MKSAECIMAQHHECDIHCDCDCHDDEGHLKAAGKRPPILRDKGSRYDPREKAAIRRSNRSKERK